MEECFTISGEELLSEISEKIGDIEDAMVGPNGAILKPTPYQLMTMSLVLDLLALLHRDLRCEYRKWKVEYQEHRQEQKDREKKGFDPYPG